MEKERNEEKSLIGRSMLKVDAAEKVTGEALYAGDLRAEGMLYGKAVRSPQAHAEVTGIEIRQALSCPGVAAVLTAADIPGENKIGMTGIKDTPVLAEGKVFFHGQAVAVVAAETKEAAEAAAEAVKISYVPLPVLNDVKTAMAGGAALLHGKPGNVSCRKLVASGDVEAALASADIIVSRTYETQMVEHSYIEPEAVLAEPLAGGGLKVWSSTKSVHMDQEEICRVTGLPRERVHVVAPYIGGSFGGKSDLAINCMAALLCLKTGRPVKMTYSREESMEASTKRHPMILRYTHGATKDGRIIAVKAEITADSGAFAGYSAPVLTRSVLHGAGPYRVPNVWIEATAIYTNNPTTGAMRGFGVPQVALACERQMDLLAVALGVDVFKIRLMNALRPGDILPSGQAVPEGSAYAETLEEARHRLEDELKARPLSCDEAWGIAGHYYGNGRTAAANPGTAVMSLLPEGKIHLSIGSPDIGQGSNTLMIQIAATALGLEMKNFILTSADSALTLNSGTTSGTRLTAIVGRGLLDTAREFKKTLLSHGARLLAERAMALPTAFLTEDEKGPCLSSGSARLYLKEIAAELSQRGETLEVAGRYDPPTKPLDDHCQGIPYASYTFGVQLVKVKVDRGTGKVRPMKVMAFYDVGRPLNPVLLEGQMEGGVAGGLGYGLLEEIQLKNGEIKNKNFDQYLLPTCLDVCPIESWFTQTLDQEGPYGAKGIGEPALIPTAAALANAVSHCLNREFNRLPISLEAVLLGE
ncbi:MAG: xanthine dehydrogenase family protein molybdopterin-binding subunit [Peptococcaceae bacterium]|nr:xanthine dehydrogenase family protein molybdopterin-binding subunit [Peptococcaceae bacterium]